MRYVLGNAPLVGERRPRRPFHGQRVSNIIVRLSAKSFFFVCTMAAAAPKDFAMKGERTDSVLVLDTSI